MNSRVIRIPEHSNRPFYKAVLIIICFSAFLFLSLTVQAQTPIWGHKVGGAVGDDRSWVSRKGPNGTVILTGTFKGTMDADPSSGVHNLSSNGQEDIFVATYTTSGTFISAFSIGGLGLDVAEGIHLTHSAIFI